MEIFGVSCEGTLKPNIRIMLVPLVLIGLLLITSVAVAKNGITKISGQLKQLNSEKRTENTLTEKAGVLQQMEGVVLDNADKTVIALPSENPSIMMLVQLNSLAEKHELVFTKREVTKTNIRIEGLQGVLISFAMQGDMEKIINFIKDVNSIAPLSNFTEVRISEKQGLYVADVGLNVFYSQFPEKIPSLNQPVTQLSNQEQIYLEKLSNLTPPAFIELPPTEPSVREDPFN